MILKIRLISGDNLLGKKQTDIEPFVKIKIHGHSTDNGKWCSKTSQNNALYSAWNDDEAEFNIKYPENAIIQFKVIKSKMKVGEKALGSYFIALSMVQKGYRRIELENSDGRKTKAGLLVKISIE